MPSSGHHVQVFFPPGEEARPTTERVQRILGRLGSHRPRVECRAATELLRLGPRAAPALVDAVRSHRNAHARGVSAIVLAKVGGRRARTALLSALRDPTMVVRLHALVALDRHLWDTRIAREVTTLVDDPSAGVRNNAIRILGERRERRASAAIRRHLRDRRPHVRREAARALAAFEGRP